MADTTFVDQQTTVLASWLNDVNNTTYRLLGTGVGGSAPATRSDIITNLGLPALYAPATGSTVYAASANLAAPTGAGLIGYTQGAFGTVARTVTAKLQEAVSVLDFGADPTGVADSTVAIQDADSYCRFAGKRMYLPGGTYLVSQLIFYTGSDWFGDGRAATIIKQKVGANTDLLYGNNSNANWGSSSPTSIVDGAAFRGLQLNGNWNNGSGNTTGNGISYYGARPILEDIFITNCAGYGIRSEFVDSSAGGNDTFTMEGWLANVRIDTVGQHGWWNNGPHDTITVGMVIVDASQSTANAWDAFYFDAKSAGRNVALRAWNRTTSKQHRYAVNCQPGSKHEFTGGCNFSGAYSANLGLFSSGCIFDSSTRFYGAWNGANVYLGGTCSNNVVKGYLDAPASGRPACIGITLGNFSGDSVADNVIEVEAVGQEAGNVYFSSYNQGNNRIRMHCFNTSTASVVGSPASTDDVDVMVHNSSGTSHVNNRKQTTSFIISSNSYASWTFLYPFSANPLVSFTPYVPTGLITGGIWISSLSPTSVTFYNNNSVSMTLDVIAQATN